jgi:hypothetical protein
MFLDLHLVLRHLTLQMRLDKELRILFVNFLDRLWTIGMLCVMLVSRLLARLQTFCKILLVINIDVFFCLFPVYVSFLTKAQNQPRGLGTNHNLLFTMYKTVSTNTSTPNPSRILSIQSLDFNFVTKSLPVPSVEPYVEYSEFVC